MTHIKSDLYKQILDNMPICCVDIVIHKDNKILLVRRDNEPAKGEWWVPGGRILKGETTKEAAIRKAKEETNLDVRIEKLLGHYELFFDKGPFGFSVHTISITFVASPIDNDKVGLDKQSSGFMWVPEIDEDFHPYLKNVLTDSSIL